MNNKASVLNTLLPLCLMFAVNSTMAQDFPTCNSQSSDPDGDGYGWENTETCLVSAADISCIDSDGDGWGWNGTASCRITATQPPNNACVDPDGDGWGWNGVSSCRTENSEIDITTPDTCIDVLPLSDGWGWNGSATCIVEVADAQLIQIPRLVDGRSAGDIYLSNDANTAAYRLTNTEGFRASNVYTTTFSSSVRTLVTADATGAEANGFSTSVNDISGDGQKLLFIDRSNNLAGMPATETTQLYLFDSSTNTLTLISVGLDGNSGDGYVDFDDNEMSNDGNHIAFSSDSSNLVVNDQNDTTDIFQYNVAQATTVRVSTTIDNLDLDTDSWLIDQSADGRYILWGGRSAREVNSIDILENDLKIFLYDSLSQTSARLFLPAFNTTDTASSSINASPLAYPMDARNTRVSNTGRIAYTVRIDNESHVAVYDPQTDSSEQLSREFPPIAGGSRDFGGFSGNPEISPDGHYVAFISTQANLLNGEQLSSSTTRNLYLRDTISETTTLVSRSVYGIPSSGNVENFRFTGDGNKLYFVSRARNLVPPGDSLYDWFVYDIDRN